jgi:apolipoprotein N-acyltransferase
VSTSGSPSRRRGGRSAALARTGLPALAGGVGLALSIPPWGFWVLAFPSAGLIWWLLGRPSPGAPPAEKPLGPRMRTRLWIGWVAGIGLYGPGLYWATTFNVYGGIVLIIAESLALAIACGACGSGRGRILALPGAMVLAEWLRDIWPFGGLPLGGVALGQASGPLAGVARLGGPLLLTGVVWLAGAGLGSLAQGAMASLAARRTSSSARTAASASSLGAEGVGSTRSAEGVRSTGGVGSNRSAEGVRSTRSAGRGQLVGGSFAVLCAILLGALGAVAPDGGPALRFVKVAAVQGGGERGLRKAQVSPAIVYAAQLDATAQLQSRHAMADTGTDPGIVVWPEDVVSLTGPLAGTTTEQTLASLARELRSSLLVGVTENVTPQTFRNEVVAFGPTGSIVGTYEKVHRVPFGEYVPYRSFFEHFANLSAVPQDAIPGHSPGFIRTPSAPVGLMISYEVFFAESGRSATRAGAQLLLVPTNTSSYSTSQVPTQEVAAARLQAIEEGRDLVQVAPTGYSAVVNNRGQVLQRSVLGARQVLVASVALRDGATVYERFGDLPVLVLAGLALLAGWTIDLTRTPKGERQRRTNSKRDERRRRQPSRDAKAHRRPVSAAID